MRRRLAWTLLAAVLALLVAACGSTTRVAEPDIVVPGSLSGAARPDAEERSDSVIRIAVVTHGQASSEFWAKVRNGIAAAARQMEVSVTYRSPDVYSLARMHELLDDAVADRPDGLVVSLPDRALVPDIRRAVHRGVPVVTINSGSELLGRVGALAHVGQPETDAGRQAGHRLALGGVERALCVDHELGNVGLQRRCRGFSEAMRRAGARVRVITVDFNDAARAEGRLQATIAGFRPDRILALNSQGAMAALRAVRTLGMHGTRIGAFDLTPEVLRAVEDGDLEFTIDQQPYLQGYLPVVMLAELARHGLFPGQGKVIPTGPHFVTDDTAAQALRLSERGIR